MIRVHARNFSILDTMIVPLEEDSVPRHLIHLLSARRFCLKLYIRRRWLGNGQPSSPDPAQDTHSLVKSGRGFFL